MPDNLTPKQRSYCMSRVKSKNTSLELKVVYLLKLRKRRFHRHPSDLPGKPDIVFKNEKVAVFIDGDFWHGYRFAAWSKKLQPKWRKKIAKNITRDKSNFSKLRRMGWKVVRVWGHSIKKDLDKVIHRIEAIVDSQDLS